MAKKRNSSPLNTFMYFSNANAEVLEYIKGEYSCDETRFVHDFRAYLSGNYFDDMLSYFNDHKQECLAIYNNICKLRSEFSRTLLSVRSLCKGNADSMREFNKIVKKFSRRSEERILKWNLNLGKSSFWNTLDSDDETESYWTSHKKMWNDIKKHLGVKKPTEVVVLDTEGCGDDWVRATLNEHDFTQKDYDLDGYSVFLLFHKDLPVIVDSQDGISFYLFKLTDIDWICDVSKLQNPSEY